MSEQQDIEARRARDLERWHRRAAERTALGLCVKCGKRPPEPERSQCEPCAEKRRAADRERHRKRAAARIADGKCPRCGVREPAAGRSICEVCAEKRNRAGRARDARLRAEGIPRRDPDRANAYERERSRRERAAREAAGICTACGTAPAAPDRVRCEPCLEKRRAADRAKYAARQGCRAALRRGSNIEVETARPPAPGARSARRRGSAAGLCIRCGAQSARRGRHHLRAVPRQESGGGAPKVRTRRAARLCTRCGGPAINGLSRCTPCAIAEEASHDPERRNARSRKLYSERKRPRLVYILRGAFAGGQPMRPVRREILSRLGAFPGDAGLGPDLDGDRAGHRARARPVRQRGRRRPLPGLREARPRPGRDSDRRESDGRVHVLVLSPGGACRRPAARLNT